MKAIRIHDFGHSDQLQLEFIDRPELQPGQLLVRIRDVGVNPVDWKIREGIRKDKFPVDFPATVGQDFAGEVLDISQGVQGFSIGDEVYGFANGAYAELAAVAAGEIALKPRSLDFVQAASIPTAGLTAWQCLVDIAGLRKGQTVLIHGAGGGVGSFAVQIAKARGARVVANASHDDKKYLTHIGADKVLDYKTEDFSKRLHDIDVVLDLVGGETQKKSAQVLKRGGILVSTVGLVDGEQMKRAGINAQAMMMTRNGRGLAELSRLADAGKLVPRVSEIIPLEEASRAQDLLQNGHPHGKVVLRV